MRVREYRLRMRHDPISFEGLRQVVAHGIPSRRPLREALQTATLHCQKGGGLRIARECLTCEHVVNVVPSGGGDVTIHCLWRENDPVRELMTLPKAFVTVDPHEDVGVADARAQAHKVHHLIVADAQGVLGLVCRCDLKREGGECLQVLSRMNSAPWAIGPEAGLGEAALLMRDENVGVLLVIEDGELVGVISRGDLLEAGVPDDVLLPAAHP